jgi:hypothetical protein
MDRFAAWSWTDLNRCRWRAVFEAADHLLAHPRWLARVVRSVVQPLVLPVFQVQPEIPVCRRAALELAGDQYMR